MVSVTERAKTYLKEAVLSQIDMPGVSARLAQTAPGELTIVPDEGKEGDQVVEHQGETVLVIDGALSNRLTGATIDCVESPRGSQLTIKRPESG